MNTKKTAASIIVMAMVVLTAFAAIVMPAGAACNSGSSNVLIYESSSDGLPPITYFTQTITQTTNPADINAAGLSNYDTLLIWRECSPDTRFTATQHADINNWVNSGGKLVIWDTECTPSVDYSWLVYPFTTNNPGAWGATGGTLTIAEENTLSSSDPTSLYYLDIASILTTDAVGDANVMTTRDTHWCLDMNATNVNGVDGPVHTYAHYGNGLIIWCGLDGDYIKHSTVGAAALRQVIINEFNQTWDNTTGADPCGLPCGVHVVPEAPCCVPVPVGPCPPGDTAVPLLTPFGAVLLIGLLAIAGVAGIRRRT